MNASRRPNAMLRQAAAGLSRRRELLPAVLLALALAMVFALNGTRDHFYAPPEWQTSIKMAIAENLSPQHGFRMFTHQSFGEDGEPFYVPYSRFPIGGFALIKLAGLPFGEHLAVKLFAARMLMLGLFAAAAFLAYQSIARIASNRWIALTAALIAFSSYYILRYSIQVSNEFMIDLFAVMLAFHGMVVFVQEGRFKQLLIKTCVALLLGWHVYAFIAPFVALGFGSELINALKIRQEFLARVKSPFSTALRSRYLMLGAVALLFGVAILLFNFTSEYTAYDGEIALVDLPSVQSMLGRTGFQPGQDGFSWGDFLRGQFYRIAGSTILPSLTNWPGVGLEAPPNKPPLHLAALGVFAASASLLGLVFARGRRILLATLALSGFCWALPLRYNTAYYGHEFEAIYYVGIPLTLVTVLLLAARGGRCRRLLPAVALAALLLFTLSALRVIPKGPEAARLTERQQTILADFAEIRKFTQGKNALVAQTIDEREALYPTITAPLLYLLGGRIRHLQPLDGSGGGASFHLLSSRLSSPTPRMEDAPAHDFVIASSKVEQFSTLTPKNSIVFLYGPVDHEELERARLDTILSGATGAPAAQSRYDVHVDGRALVYFKEPCEANDIASRFFLHILPARVDDLPEWRKPHRYDNLDFDFHLHGVALDGKCAAKVPLPAYAIKGVRTGQWTNAGGQIWSVAFSFAPAAIQSAYEAIRARDPDVRAAFDLYLDKETRVLTYVRESCAPSDMEGPFFLHVTPNSADDLPNERREYGFDNLDFDFQLHGAMFDGKCAAVVSLPQYEILSLRTGQWTRGAGEIWKATLRLSP